MVLKNITDNRNLLEECILTQREIECLSLVSLGYTNSQAAKIIAVSMGMFKKNLEDIFQKLSAINRTHAVALGFLHKILDIAVLNDVIAKYNLKPLGKERLD